MFDVARFVEAQRLLDVVAAVEDRLAPHERELYRRLKAKYAEPGQTEADDLTCLEVMLRNVEIRKGYRIDPDRNPGRVIEVKRTRRPTRR